MPNDATSPILMAVGAAGPAGSETKLAMPVAGIHHGANETYVHVIRGSVTTHFGPGGGESIEARAGDFFIVPPDTIHRETTGQESDVEAFIVRVGGEPEHISVDNLDR